MKITEDEAMNSVLYYFCIVFLLPFHLLTQSVSKVDTYNAFTVKL